MPRGKVRGGYDIEDVWAFRLPESDHWTSLEAHGAFWREWMHGGIERFGRHPHRNALLGRAGAPAEQAHSEVREIPHEHTRDLGKEAVEPGAAQG